jgi:hypothetical protein
MGSPPYPVTMKIPPPFHQQEGVPPSKSPVPQASFPVELRRRTIRECNPFFGGYPPLPCPEGYLCQGSLQVQGGVPPSPHSYREGIPTSRVSCSASTVSHRVTSEIERGMRRFFWGVTPHPMPGEGGHPMFLNVWGVSPPSLPPAYEVGTPQGVYSIVVSLRSFHSKDRRCKKKIA